jgi:hypothetical protein
MAIDNKIPVIRALWGSQERTLKEIFPKPLFKNEVVMVWGTANKEYLQSLGYTVKTISGYETDPRYTTIHTHYLHKLEAIKIAGVLYSEYLFLDWDCYPLRLFDDTFYDYLQKGNEVQIPLYAYPDEKGLGIVGMMKRSAPWGSVVTVNLEQYITSHEVQLRQYSWQKDGMLISPNFGFVYSRRPSLGKELLQIVHINDIENCVEEHATYVWANCSLEEYITKHEPRVVQGMPNDARMNLQDDSVTKLNIYINFKAEKDLYLKHI